MQTLLNALGYSLTVHTQRYDEAYALIYEAHLYDPGSAAILDSLALGRIQKRQLC